MKDATRNRLKLLRDYVDGDADTPFEYAMLFVIIVNTVSIGLESVKNLSEPMLRILEWVDYVCFAIFVGELIFKAVVYNRNFFGENRKDERGNTFLFINWWNTSDLIIVVVSAFSECYAAFRIFRLARSLRFLKAIRSFRVVRVFKLVNEFSSLRSIFKGLVRAIPGIFATFCFLSVFAYVYGILGTNIFGDEFPRDFGNLGISILTLCRGLTLDSWFSGIMKDVMGKFPWAWVYFVSYAFIAASVIMNVIVGIIVDSMAKERELRKDDATEVTLEKLSAQIEELRRIVEDARRSEYTEKNNPGWFGLGGKKANQAEVADHLGTKHTDI
jgi:voltage-gated sodium channel